MEQSVKRTDVRFDKEARYENESHEDVRVKQVDAVDKHIFMVNKEQPQTKHDQVGKVGD